MPSLDPIDWLRIVTHMLGLRYGVTPRATDDSRTAPKRRQAVLLIHGIGEQRPMSTLRGFVSALLPGGGFRSKPDDLSLSFELRRLTHEDKNIQTCFFEYYWAYRMRDTGIRHLYSWGKHLLWNRLDNVPRRLKKYWCIAWLTTFIAILAFAVATACFVVYVIVSVLWLFHLSAGTTRDYWENATKAFPAISALATLVFAAISGGIIYWLGDAARYLHSTPANVAERQAIRHDGLELLRRLHQIRDRAQPKYDRIIVVGHSLGGVIGYDILSFYWAQVHDDIPIYDRGKLEQLDRRGSDLDKISRRIDIEGVASAKEEELLVVGRKAYGDAQEGLRQGLSKVCPWRITDFVTLGTPLTYGDFLLAESYRDLTRRQDDRELPCTPPVTEQGHAWYEDKDTKLAYLHHAALFSVTRWTNLYFARDTIGGPLQRCFGPGVEDIKCVPSGLAKVCGLLSHVSYWKDARSSHVARLKGIVFGRWISAQ